MTIEEACALVIANRADLRKRFRASVEGLQTPDNRLAGGVLFNYQMYQHAQTDEDMPDHIKTDWQDAFIHQVVRYFGDVELPGLPFEPLPFDEVEPA